MMVGETWQNDNNDERWDMLQRAAPISIARQRAQQKQFERGNHPIHTRPSQEVRDDWPRYVLTGPRYREALNNRLKNRLYYDGSNYES